MRRPRKFSLVIKECVPFDAGESLINFSNKDGLIVEARFSDYL